MAQLTYTQIGIQGSNPGYTAASAGGDKVPPNDRGVVLIRNGSGSSINVTVDVPGLTKYGLPNPDPVISVPAGTDRAIGPFGADLAGTDGLVSLAYSAVTSVTVAAVTI